ncbi:MAG TPA: hypothetical protein VFV50_11330 [Bdellovibrionales bacterium]|nr:hypothetical protein [Bdellovibrionales bacterium]
MKALTATETENLKGLLETMVGFKLQSAEGYAKGVVLRLYGPGRSVWCVLEMDPARPLLLISHEEPEGLAKAVKPLVLFVKANLTGGALTGVHVPTARVLALELTTGTIEVRLFPHGENIIAKAGTKSVAWKPVAELKPVGPADSPSRDGRSAQELLNEWRGLREKKPIRGVKPSLAKTLEKKKIALERLRKDITEKESAPWERAGELVKASQNLNVPEELASCIDRKLSLAENIQNCFTKAKENRRKIAASRARELALKTEIVALEAALNAPIPETDEVEHEPSKPKRDLALKSGKLKARRLDLDDGKIAYLGRSAADNLALLRAANAWDLWLHMKDYPGAHLIVRRNRGQDVTSAELEQAARWLASETPQSKRELRPGDHFDVQLAEVRFVRPIKGDRLGRVSVTDPRVLRFRL